VQFQGIGAVLHRGDDGSVAVREVLEDGPAAQSGLRAGDVIVRVDDVLAAKLGLGEVIDLIRGERGTEVRLEVQRGPAAQTHFLIIDRGRVSYQRRRH
jgi:carboxyl-terminal processing protease